MHCDCRSDKLADMKRTTINLPEDLDARLRREAQRRGTTISEIAREAIETHLGMLSGRRRLNAAGAGASGRTNVAERIEQILAVEFGSRR
jgi:predicted transcriptional regulator